MKAAVANGEPANVYVDAHVHLYPFMSVRRVLDAAERNLLGGRDGSRSACGLIVVADPEGVEGYARLLAHAAVPPDRDEPDPWRREAVDSRSVIFRRPSGTSIVAVQGQQLITGEGLEVLGAGYTGKLPSGLPLAALVDRIRARGGSSIVAWGAGKWLGRRGRIVAEMINAEGGRPDVMLADNGGRPWCWSRVPQFELAAARGMRIVAGSDPLPLQGEENRVGSYGFRVRVDRTGDRPVADAFWRDGLQPGQGEPLVLSLDPHLDLPQLEKLGYAVFVSTDALLSFVKRRNQEASGEESTDEAVTA